MVKAEQDMPIYSDNLVNGWEDWGWAPRSLTNTTPVHTGTRSINVDPGTWTGLYFSHKPLNTTPYTNLVFWVHGGDEGGQLLQVGTKLGTNEQAAYQLPALPPGSWQQFIIPLDTLTVADATNLTGVLIMMRNDSPQRVYYVDDIRLEAKVVPKSAEVTPAPAPPVTNVPAPAPKPDLTLWIAAALALIVALLGWLVLIVKRSSARPANERALVLANTIPGIHGGNGNDEGWRQRALTAEAVASKQAQILREKLTPELGRIAKDAVVQGLVEQRNSMLDTQRLAELELAELETRLSELQLPQQERILAYEKRIAELESELVSRKEEMRELVRVTLTLVRQRLDEEKKKPAPRNGVKPTPTS